MNVQVGKAEADAIYRRKDRNELLRLRAEAAAESEQDLEPEWFRSIDWDALPGAHEGRSPDADSDAEKR